MHLYGRTRKRGRSSYGRVRAIGRVRGRGSYWRDFGSSLLRGGGAALGGAGGAALGGPVGAVIGGAAGEALGGGISRISGLGAYKIKKNGFMINEGLQVPSFDAMSNGVIISHREYISDVNVPAVSSGILFGFILDPELIEIQGTFSNTSYALNPGIASTFPWLSTIAKCFDQYQWRGMLFEFRSTSADVGSTTALGMGTVIMSTDYDAADADFTSKIQMENNQYTCSTRPSISAVHAIECDPSVTVQPMLYVRTGTLPTTSSLDIRFYDHGK